jgi:hypothetical protein
VDTTVLLLILIGVVCIVAATIAGGFELPPKGTTRAELRQDGRYNVRTEPRLVHPGIPTDLVVEQTPTAGTLWCFADEVVIGVTK